MVLTFGDHLISFLNLFMLISLRACALFFFLRGACAIYSASSSSAGVILFTNFQACAPSFLTITFRLAYVLRQRKLVVCIHTDVGFLFRQADELADFVVRTHPFYSTSAVASVRIPSNVRGLLSSRDINTVSRQAGARSLHTCTGITISLHGFLFQMKQEFNVDINSGW